MNERRVYELANMIFPDLVRYGGLAIALKAGFIDHSDRPSVYLLAAGMMGLKTVIKAAKDGQEK